MAPLTQTSSTRRSTVSSQGACPSAALAAAAAAAAATEAAGAAGEAAGTPEQQLTGYWDGERWVTKRASASARPSVLGAASNGEKDPCSALLAQQQAAWAGEPDAGSRRNSRQSKESLAQHIKRLSLQGDALSTAPGATKEDVAQPTKRSSVADNGNEAKRSSVASLEQIAQQIRRMSHGEAQQQQKEEPKTEEEPREESRHEAGKEDSQLAPGPEVSPPQEDSLNASIDALTAQIQSEFQGRGHAEPNGDSAFEQCLELQRHRETKDGGIERVSLRVERLMSGEGFVGNGGEAPTSPSRAQRAPFVCAVSPVKDVVEMSVDIGMQTPRANELETSAEKAVPAAAAPNGEVQIKVDKDRSRKLLKKIKLDMSVTEQNRAFVWTFGRHSGRPERPGAHVRVLKGPWKEEGERLGVHRGDLLVSINGVAVAELLEADIRNVWRVQRDTGSFVLELQEELSK